MNEKQEQAYIQGSRAAWSAMLQQCLINLGYEDLEAQKMRWILERESAITQLRNVCEAFGDNEWEESLNLADVIEKHLAKHLFSN